MNSIHFEIFSLMPAFAFLLTGVPLAVLLDRLGFFQSAAIFLLKRNPSVLKLWILAAVTTAMLNLDTTIVLLTPLYIHIAKKTKNNTLPLLVIPLLLASFASSLLPVSNLTNIIVASSLHLSAIDFLLHLAIPTIIAVTAGWFFYRMRFSGKLIVTTPDKQYDKKSFIIGCFVVLYLLIGFVFGVQFGIQPWLVALVADIVLVVLTGFIPWQSIPIRTAILVAVIATVASLVISSEMLHGVFDIHSQPEQMIRAVLLATIGTNTINNLPTVLVGVHSTPSMNWFMWAWLVGVNVGAVLLPIGALANLLWLHIAKHNGMSVSLWRYLSITLPIGMPTLFVTFLVLLLEYFLTAR